MLLSSGYQLIDPPAAIAQFRYIKMQPETITSLRGSGEQIAAFIWVYSPEPRSDVYCFRLNLNISKLGYLMFLKQILQY